MPANSDRPQDRIASRIAALEAIVAVKTDTIAHHLERIESKLDALLEDGQELDVRVAKVEKDIDWFKKIGAPMLAIIPTVVSGWIKGVLNI